MDSTEADAERNASVLRVSDALAGTDSQDSLRDALHRLQLRVFVDLNRLALIALLAAAMFATVFAVVTVGPLTEYEYLIGGVLLSKAYIELQTMVVTVITIVLAINEMVLTPELGTISDQRRRVDGVVENREKLEELSGRDAAPTNPSGYLRAVVEATRTCARDLRAAVDDDTHPEFREEALGFADDLVAQADTIDAALAGREFGTIELLGAAMHFTTSDDIHTARRLQNRYEGALADDEREALSDLEEALELYTVTREYFRELFVQSEFVNFSRALLVVGPIALVTAHLTVGIIDSNAIAGATLGVGNLFWYELAAFSVVLLPVLVVISYAARLSLLAKATIFVSPISPGPDREH
ncbi:MAG: hypothetical protein ABEJ31_00335 [Haloarculaceae archaeon]